MMDTRDVAAEVETAAQYRTEAAEFRAEAQRARFEGDEDRAFAMEASAADLSVLAAGIERAVRGLPPLPAAGRWEQP